MAQRDFHNVLAQLRESEEQNELSRETFRHGFKAVGLSTLSGACLVLSIWSWFSGNPWWASVLLLILTSVSIFQANSSQRDFERMAKIQDRAYFRASVLAAQDEPEMELAGFPELASRLTQESRS